MPATKTFPDGERYQNVDGILKIVADGLCHRCGGCVGCCPVGTFDMDPDGFPRVIADCIQCGLCTQICSGHHVEYSALGSSLFGPSYKYGPALGEYKAAYVGHGVEDDVRWRGASGGVVSQLLVSLLEAGKIKGALVTIQHPDDTSRGKGIIARTRDEILTAAQSRYAPSTGLAALRDISRESGPFAVVALPCQIHSLRQWQAADRSWRERISLVIGLLCHFYLPPQATREPAALLAPRGTKVTRVNYRQKNKAGWPGNTVEMTFSDGTTWRSPFGPAQTVNLLGFAYPRERCGTCLDATAELADIVAGDPWILNAEGNWKYEAPAGLSSVIVRTEAGAAALDYAVQQGKINLQPISAREIELGQQAMMNEKKAGIPFRIALRKSLHLPIPSYPPPIAFPKPTWKILSREFVFYLTRLITLIGPLRRAVVRFSFSSAGQAYMRRRDRIKRERAAARARTG